MTKSLFELASMTYCLFLLVPVPAPGPDEDMNRLQGTWHITRWFDPQEGEVKVEELKNVEIVVSQDRSTWSVGDELISVSRFKLAPTKIPKEVDFFTIKGEDEGKLMRGIYAFEKEQLKLVVNQNGIERPASFAEVEAKKHTILVMKKKT